MLTAHLDISDWLSLPNPVRHQLIEIFNIPKSGGVVMEDGKCLSDGHSVEDLSVVTVEAMQAYLGTPLAKDFYDLLNTVVEMIEHPTVEISRTLTKEELAKLVPGAKIKLKK